MQHSSSSSSNNNSSSGRGYEDHRPIFGLRLGDTGHFAFTSQLGTFLETLQASSPAFDLVRLVLLHHLEELGAVHAWFVWESVNKTVQAIWSPANAFGSVLGPDFFRCWTMLRPTETETATYPLLGSAPAIPSPFCRPDLTIRLLFPRDLRLLVDHISEQLQFLNSAMLFPLRDADARLLAVSLTEACINQLSANVPSASSSSFAPWICIETALLPTDFDVRLEEGLLTRPNMLQFPRSTSDEHAAALFSSRPLRCLVYRCSLDADDVGVPETERVFLQSVSDRLTLTTAWKNLALDALLCQKGVSSSLKRWCLKNKVLVIERIGLERIELVASMCRCRPVDSVLGAALLSPSKNTGCMSVSPLRLPAADRAGSCYFLLRSDSPAAGGSATPVPAVQSLILQASDEMGLRELRRLADGLVIYLKHLLVDPLFFDTAAVRSFFRSEHLFESLTAVSKTAFHTTWRRRRFLFASSLLCDLLEEGMVRLSQGKLLHISTFASSVDAILETVNLLAGANPAAAAR